MGSRMTQNMNEIGLLMRKFIKVCKYYDYEFQALFFLYNYNISDDVLDTAFG